MLCCSEEQRLFQMTGFLRCRTSLDVMSSQFRLYKIKVSVIIFKTAYLNYDFVFFLVPCQVNSVINRKLEHNCLLLLSFCVTGKGPQIKFPTSLPKNETINRRLVFFRFNSSGRLQLCYPCLSYCCQLHAVGKISINKTGIYEKEFISHC